MTSLNSDQITAWRLAQHRLVERAGRRELLDVVAALGGLQAQVLSAAELALWARVADLAPDDVANALWSERTLVKTWALRGTLHLLAASEFPRYAAALGTLKHFRRASWLNYHGVTLPELESLIDGVRETLSDTGVTREQLADAVAERAGNPQLRELLRSGWGALLKPAAFGGLICFGPSQGQNVTFVRPDRWLGAWQPRDPEQSLAEIARRYLLAYGPATPEEFARWLGLEPSAAKRVFRALDDTLAAVEVDGQPGWMVRDALPQIAACAPAHTVRLLPGFDPYTIALYRRPEVLGAEYRPRVSRAQGWISPVVLVDGRIEGVWEYDKRRTEVAVTLAMFAPPAPEIRRAIEAEAVRLGQFLGAEAVVRDG